MFFLERSDISRLAIFQTSGEIIKHLKRVRNNELCNDILLNKDATYPLDLEKKDVGGTLLLILRVF